MTNSYYLSIMNLEQNYIYRTMKTYPTITLTRNRKDLISEISKNRQNKWKDANSGRDFAQLVLPNWTDARLATREREASCRRKKTTQAMPDDTHAKNKCSEKRQGFKNWYFPIWKLTFLQVSNLTFFQVLNWYLSWFKNCCFSR